MAGPLVEVDPSKPLAAGSLRGKIALFSLVPVAINVFYSVTGSDNLYLGERHFIGLANYATLPYDKVVKNGKTVGLSTYTGYTYNERSWLSLGIMNNAEAVPGTEVTLVWGEEGRGSTKPTVERHKQLEIRAIVSPVPYGKQAQTSYHEGWRSKAIA